MTTINDGGPAFPARKVDEDGVETQAYGMSLRDYFAGQAMQAILSLGNDYTYETDMKVKDIVARDAYHVADAMIKARGS